MERPVVPCAGGHSGSVGDAPARYRGAPQERGDLAQGLRRGRTLPALPQAAPAPARGHMGHPGMRCSFLLLCRPMADQLCQLATNHIQETSKSLVRGPCHWRGTMQPWRVCWYIESQTGCAGRVIKVLKVPLPQSILSFQHRHW